MFNNVLFLDKWYLSNSVWTTYLNLKEFCEICIITAPIIQLRKSRPRKVAAFQPRSRTPNILSSLQATETGDNEGQPWFLLLCSVGSDSREGEVSEIHVSCGMLRGSPELDPNLASRQAGFQCAWYLKIPSFSEFVLCWDLCLVLLLIPGTVWEKLHSFSS